MKVLYVSDLDGTLLRRDETLSELTCQTINHLVEQGMLFSYATARSFTTSYKVTKGLNAKMPLIVYNGSMIIDNESKDIILSNFFEKGEIEALISDLISHQVYPIVYAFIQGEEKFSYVERLNTVGMQNFIRTRRGDPREHAITSLNQLSDGECFYVTCIDEKDKLEPLYQRYKDKYHCIFHEDIYLHDQWLELLPQNASKSIAAKQLKEYYHCDYMIAFGDGKNDIDLFKVADEAYAVSNADEELKKVATGIIGNHNDDAIAKWLLENYKKFK